jgi:hypothetical protein
MFAIEDIGGGCLINIDNLNIKGLWNGVDIINKYNFNIDKCEINDILYFVVKKGIKKIIEDDNNIGISIITNLKNTYFYIMRDDKHTRRYYMRKYYNCTEYDIKKGRRDNYYLMGVIVVRDDLNKVEKKSSVIIDWIEAYYNKTGTAKNIICLLEKHFDINLIPTNINPAYKYWKKYLIKNYKIKSFEDFKYHLWNSSYNIENYFNIAYDIEGYSKIYDINDEDIDLRLLYDY